MSVLGTKLAQALGRPEPRGPVAARGIAPSCPYCGARAELVAGSDLYPHRPDLHELKFWACAPCEAHVGCHKAGSWTFDAKGHRVFSDGTLPLGRLADAALRQAKLRVHRAFDPLWQGASQQGAARLAAYAWLAQAMDIDKNECHIGAFDLVACERAAVLAEARLARLQAGDAAAAFTG